MLNLTIIEAQRDQSEMIAELSRETFLESFAAQNTKANMDLYLSQHFKPYQIAEEFDEPNARIFLALVDGIIAGYAKVTSKYHPAKLNGVKTMELERLYVRSQFQGKKIGEALMQYCIAYAKSLQRNILWLGVWEHNHKAIRFYERLGFTKFDEHDFVLGSDVQIDWMMKLELGSEQ